MLVQDLFLTETARRADVVLPAVAYTEKDGSFTNTERCVQAVRRAMTPLPGARADWEILQDVARALGLRWSYRSAADVLTEIGRSVPIYAGVTHRALGASGVRWPLAPAGGRDDGARAVAGTAYLTGEMLRGDMPVGADGELPVLGDLHAGTAGRGE
jgi:predicted molibdopterin-dependent oxidoreductase YjgC